MEMDRQNFEEWAADLQERNARLQKELIARNRELEEFNRRLEREVAARTSTLEQANHQLRSYQSDLVRLETQNSLTHLLRGLVHEINNPLSVILGQSETIQRKRGDDEDLVRRMGLVQKEVERCIGLVERLRSFTSPLEQRIRPCHVADVVEMAIERLRKRQIAHPSIEISEMVPQIAAAPEALARVFEQIIRNAADAGARRVTVEGGTEGDRAEIRCLNDGRTPTAEEIKEALHPFYTSDPGNRSGLGLTLSSSLLREQGGSLTLATRSDGEGTEIAIKISPAGTTVARRAMAMPESAPPLLFVGDDPLLDDTVRRACDRLERPILRAETPLRAAAAIEEHEIGASIVDASYGDEPIRALLDIFRSRCPSRRILVLGHVQELENLGPLLAEHDCLRLTHPVAPEDIDEALAGKLPD